MLGIVQNGIVRVLEDGTTQIVRPRKNGGAPRLVSVPDPIASQYRLSAGDIVEADTEAIEIEHPADFLEATDCQLLPLEEDVDLQYDEPARQRAWSAPTSSLRPTEMVSTIRRINGLDAAQAEDRPYPKSRRSQSERTPPDRLLSLARGDQDTIGRMLDFSAPLGCGDIGAIMGPHNSGLTRTMSALVEGITKNSPDCVVIVMIMRARGEEVTEFRNRFPDTDIVVCSADTGELSPDDSLLLPTLILETAQRQSEMGKNVVLAIDSLTALWGTMLELEDASDQRNADVSKSRQRIREYLQRAGCFHGESPLGGSLGGSITIVGTIWNQPFDQEAEDDRELHPHLRLFEQIVSDLTWLIVLNGELAVRRLYPAIDIRGCMSRNEESLLDADLLESLLTARGLLPRNEPVACYSRMMNALDEPCDLAELCWRIAAA